MVGELRLRHLLAMESLFGEGLLEAVVSVHHRLACLHEGCRVAVRFGVDVLRPSPGQLPIRHLERVIPIGNIVYLTVRICHEVGHLMLADDIGPSEHSLGWRRSLI